MSYVTLVDNVFTQNTLHRYKGFDIISIIYEGMFDMLALLR